ncbi:hypothetical protein [Bosea lathyri]|uniref:Uncharacterized protein n=1 Tax=Bosea lathyri TaxID=1036778 RepID=A0A1H6BKN5_9HYPH|nr:hypothetical protein [Bosea lathyri]SEG61269.1 hypothetical protein SAMN04488115_107322 [Bosea lathyri]
MSASTARDERPSFYIQAATDPIRCTGAFVEYADETLLVEPIESVTEDNFLAVVALDHGLPRLVRLKSTGRDGDGRFTPKGDPKEAFTINDAFTFERRDFGKFVHILGRAVDQTRSFPKLTIGGRS